MNISFFQSEKKPNLSVGLNDIAFLQKARESVDEILGFIEVGMPVKDIDSNKLKDNIASGFMKIAQFGVDRSVESLQSKGDLPDAIDVDQFKIDRISEYTKEFSAKDFLVNIEDDNGLVDSAMLEESKDFMIQNAIDYAEEKVKSISDSLYEKEDRVVSPMLIHSLSKSELPNNFAKDFMILDLKKGHMSTSDLEYLKHYLEKNNTKAISVLLPKDTDDVLIDWYKSSLKTKKCNFYPMKEESLDKMNSDQRAKIIESILREKTAVVGYSEDSRSDLLDNLLDRLKTASLNKRSQDQR